MKLAVFSDTRLPTLPEGGHGLGMSAHEIATGLAAHGHTVDMVAGVGSQYDAGDLFEFRDELRAAMEFDITGYDAVLDTSHVHWLSKINRDAPIVNRICDRECLWSPPNIAVNSPYMQLHYGGKLVNTGIKESPLWFNANPRRQTAVFLSAQHAHKGLHIARRVAEQASVELVVLSGLNQDQKWEALSMAGMLLHPSLGDAAPRLPLEAAMVGTPTICFAQDGAQYHVCDQVSGFVCRNEPEMVTAVSRAGEIKPMTCRQWATDYHGYEAMIDAYAGLLTAVSQGERW